MVLHRCKVVLEAPGLDIRLKCGFLSPAKLYRQPCQCDAVRYAATCHACSQVPSAVGLLWLSNSIYGIAQGALFRSPGFRAALNLPDIKVRRGVGYLQVYKFFLCFCKPTCFALWRKPFASCGEQASWCTLSSIACCETLPFCTSSVVQILPARRNSTPVLSRNIAQLH